MARARVLLAQNRAAEAEPHVRRALAANPQSAPAHCLLAQSLADQEKHAEALREARAAVHLAPDHDFAHYVLAVVHSRLDQDAEAEAAIREALRLDPADADYHALLSGILSDRRRWPEALAAAEEGLRVDAEHVMCANLRAHALLKLGRRAEAHATLDSALARDPDNALTHANRGWALLHGNDPRGALEHFREALRLDPTDQFAREGIVQALRARNIIYRLMLAYFLWMARFDRKVQMGLIVGAWILVRGLRGAAKANPALTPFVAPVIVMYLVFVFLSWTAGPLFDLLLRLDRFGRLALSPQRVRASNCVGGLLLGALFLAAAWALTGRAHAALLGGAAAAALLVIPAAATFNAPTARARQILLAYTLSLGAVALTAVAMWFINSDVGLLLGAVFLLGWAAFTWVANFVRLR